MRQYLRGKINKSDADQIILNFCTRISPYITDNNSFIDQDLACQIVERFTFGMNWTASEMVGFEPAKTWSDRMKIRLGRMAPTPRKLSRELDDEYWERQFIDDYEEFRGRTIDGQELAIPGDVNGSYLYEVVHGFPFAFFTHNAAVIASQYQNGEL